MNFCTKNNFSHQIIYSVSFIYKLTGIYVSSHLSPLTSHLSGCYIPNVRRSKLVHPKFPWNLCDVFLPKFLRKRFNVFAFVSFCFWATSPCCLKAFTPQLKEKNYVYFSMILLFIYLLSFT